MSNHMILNHKKNKFTLILSFILPLALYGCHTIEGVGTDIKQGGEALEHAAEDNTPCPRACPSCGRRY